MSLVFISYSRTDQVFVRQIVTDLQQRSISTWVDYQDIKPGERWDIAIEKAVQGVSYVVLVLSTRSSESPNVRDEIDMAIDAGRTILPILLEECKPPLQVRRIQWIDFRGGYASALDKLIGAMTVSTQPQSMSANYTALTEAFSASNSADSLRIETTRTPNQVALALQDQAQRIAKGYEDIQANIIRLQQAAPLSTGWITVAFDELTDTTLVNVVCDDPDPQIAHNTALICAEIRSKLIVNQLAQRALTGHRRAFQGLVWIREEVSALPLEVNTALKRRIFAKISQQQLMQRPGIFLFRYISAAVGYGIGLGIIIFVQFSNVSGLDAIAVARERSAIAIGLQYGLLEGLSIVVSTEFATRLKVWPTASRIGLALLGGMLVSILTFSFFDLSFYDRPASIGWNTISAAILSAGFSIPSGLTSNTWLRVFMAVAGTFLAFYLPWKVDRLNAPIAISSYSLALPLCVILSLTVGLATFIPELYAKLAELVVRQSLKRSGGNMTN